MSDVQTLELFQPHLNSTFTIQFEDFGAFPLELSEAKAINSWQPKGGIERTPFALVFKTDPKLPALNQGMFQLDHAILGKQSLFLVPIDQREDGRYYEAVFT